VAEEGRAGLSELLDFGHAGVEGAYFSLAGLIIQSYTVVDESKLILA
jgi:hypothetical protein